jgi:hypothetical protein
VTPLPRLTALLRAGLVAALVSACVDAPDAIVGPTAPSPALAQGQGLDAALAAKARHAPSLMRIPGVVGTAVGRLPNGAPVVRIFVSRPDVAGLPAVLDGVPAQVTVSGLFMARSDPTTRQRPAPLGFSVGHFAITAGTIGALVQNAAGDVFILSNNHVLANSNNAAVGDAILQPGPFDGGTNPADQIATLAAFQAIDFAGGSNLVDAALARPASVADVSSATPTDDGYGAPSGQLFNDGNGDGTFDNIAGLLGVNVQKYGRTTELTHGQITGINATVTVCYEAILNIFCIKSATFDDQLLIEPGGFSGGGDSGSLIVTDDASRNPVGLLFAGSTAQTIANRIDRVLNRFGVSIVAEDAPPPTPLSDVAVTGVSAPASVLQGSAANVVVTVRNVGNQNVASAFDVTLRDVTGNATIGTQSVGGLAAGASTNLTFSWNTSGASLGTHALAASHAFADENAANDQATTTVDVTSQAAGVHIGDLDATPSSGGTSWSVIVDVTVHDANHNPINGATVVGTWTPKAFLTVNTCTTGEFGGNGTCIMLYPSISNRRKSVSFTVNSVTLAGQAYVSSANHDPDGSSNGTSIKVNKP